MDDDMPDVMGGGSTQSKNRPVRHFKIDNGPARERARELVAMLTMHPRIVEKIKLVRLDVSNASEVERLYDIVRQELIDLSPKNLPIIEAVEEILTSETKDDQNPS